MKFAKKVPARLAEFTLLLIFVGLTILPGFAQERAKQPHIGLVHDWSHRHIVFTDTNDVQTRVKQGSDLRAASSWARRTRVQRPNRFGRALVERQGRAAVNKKKKGGPGSAGAISGLSVDWALPLGKGRGASAANYAGLAAGAYPAKYSFDINAAPNCTNDFIAMGLSTPGLAGYPNIVGINNLYSNAGGTGFCPGTGPAAYFAYFTAAANPTSVVMSLDGTKIAWVENAATAVFHVLAWKAGDGTLAAPIDLSTRVVASAPVADGTGGHVTNLTLASTDTNSSPYYDYTTDTAYVGNNNSQLFKIRNVFCQTIASPAPNSTCAGAQPSLDPAWAVNPVAVSATAGLILTSPVVDTYLATPLVFVGGSSTAAVSGSVYARVAATGVAPTTPTLAVGDSNNANGRVIDPPVLDVTNHRLYVTTGCDSTANSAVAVQNPYTATGFGTSIIANIGQDTSGTNCPDTTTNMHAGTPDDAYISAIQGGTAGGHMIFCGTEIVSNPTVATAVLYRFPISGAGVMSTTATATSAPAGTALPFGMGPSNADTECSAVTDVFNSNFAAPTERIYAGMGGTTYGQLRSFDANFTTPGAASVSRNVTSWSHTAGVVTLNTNLDVGAVPGSYVTIAGTSGNGAGIDCLPTAAGTNGAFEVLTHAGTQITFSNTAITTIGTCTGLINTGTAIGDSSIQSLSFVDVTTPFALRATSGIIIDNVAATGLFAEASNIYFTQVGGAGNIAGGSCAATATIANITRPGGGVSLVTTSAAHGLAVGDSVTISGNATATNNGVFAVIAPVTGTSFTYADATGAAGAGGSVFAQACFYKLSQEGLQ